jgi:phosphoglucosamine mutase
MVSASHNPFDYNGFKIFSPNGYKLSDDEESEMEDLLLSPTLALPDELQRTPGRFVDLRDGDEEYVRFLLTTVPLDFRLGDMKIVLDCANGAMFRVAPDLFQRLGAEVEALFVRPDGTNINKNCGSQHPDALSRRVVSLGANLGLAFDGDGDRLIAVDEKGQTLTGDQVLTICGKMLKEKGELRNNLLVSTVMSNLGLHHALKRLGIEHGSTQVGDRYVLEEMRAKQAVLGGEDSGHIIFLNYHTTGDGLLSGMQLVAAMKTFDQPLSKLSKLMTVFPQTLINVPVKTKPLLSTVTELTREIDRVEKRLGDRGRVLVRYSGTEPVCRVMLEGESREEVETCAVEIAEAVRQNLGA